MDTNKLDYIKSKLGTEYLSKLDMEINSDKDMPEYEFLTNVYNAFDTNFPELSREYDSYREEYDMPCTKPVMTKRLQEQIGDILALKIYADYALNYKEYNVSRNFFTSEFQNNKDIILNSARRTTLIAVFNKLKAHPAESTSGVNNTALLNHIKYVAKQLVFQYSLRKGIIKKYDDTLYYKV